MHTGTAYRWHTHRTVQGVRASEGLPAIQLANMPCRAVR